MDVNIVKFHPFVGFKANEIITHIDGNSMLVMHTSMRGHGISGFYKFMQVGMHFKSHALVPKSTQYKFMQLCYKHAQSNSIVELQTCEMMGKFQEGPYEIMYIFMRY